MFCHQSKQGLNKEFTLINKHRLIRPSLNAIKQINICFGIRVCLIKLINTHCRIAKDSGWYSQYKFRPKQS